MKSPRLQNLTIFRMGVLNSYRFFDIWHIELPLACEMKITKILILK